MDLKVYEKTRYQNIYRHKKNKNLIIMISKPIKTSIARDSDNNKIFDFDIAIKIRDKALYKMNQDKFSDFKAFPDTLYDKYINICINERKLAYNSINRKTKAYNKYVRSKINKPLIKVTKNEWISLIDHCNCSNKQKNNVMKELKCLFNWCVQENILIFNPLNGVKKYKVEKCEMKYWTTDELKTFLSYLNNEIKSNNIVKKKTAYLIKILTLIGFSLGDRIGETRALRFGDIDYHNKIIRIRHSINYDRNSNDFCCTTKNYQSQRDVDVSDKLLNEINEYRHFLEVDLELDINDYTLIFFNHSNNKPYSDATLRKHFYKYCELSGVRKIRMYDLRHTFATTMMTDGKDPYSFSKRMGHKSIKITIDVYGHISKQLRKEIVETTDKYI